MPDVDELKVGMSLDASGVESGAQRAEKALEGVADTAEKSGERSASGISEINRAILEASRMVAAQMKQISTQLSEANVAIQQNGRAISDITGSIAALNTAGKQAAQGTKGADDAMKALGLSAQISSRRMAMINEEMQTLTDQKRVMENQGYGLGYADYDRIIQRMNELKEVQAEYRRNLTQPTTVNVDTSQVTNLSAQLKQAQQDLKSLANAGFGFGNENYDIQYQEVVRLTDAVREYKAELDDAVRNPAPSLGAQVTEHIRQAFASVAGMVNNTLGRAFQMAGREVSRFAGKLISLAPGTSILKSVVDRLRGVKSGGDGANSALSGIVRQIRNINLAGMALRGVTLLFGRLRSVVQQYLSENAAAKNAVDGLKSAFANALAPAINVAINALSAILPYIQAVSNAFATLVTNLLGAEWTTISGAASDMSGVASATKDAAQAQKELNRELYSFDEINKQSDNSSGGSSGGSGGGGGTTTSTIPGGKGALELFAQLADLFQPIKDAWDNVGAGVVDSIQTAFETIKQTATDVGASFVNVWTDGTGQAWAESMLENFRSLVDLGTAFVGTFDQAWTEAGRGDEVIRSIFELMTEVNGMLTDIQDAFTNVWNNGTGKKIWGDILDIITNVNGAVSGLAGQFRKAWNEAGNGEGIWQGILDIVESVLGHVKGMTDATKKWAKNLNLEPLMNSVGRLVDAVKPWVDGVGSLLENIYKNNILPFADWLAESGIPATIDTIASLLETISGAVQSVVDFLGIDRKGQEAYDYPTIARQKQEAASNGGQGILPSWWEGVNAWRDEHIGGFNLGDWLDNFEPYHWDISTAGASNRIIPGSSTTKPLQGTVRPILPLNMEKNSADAIDRIKKATLEMRDQMQGKMGVNGDNAKTGVNAIKLNARLTAQGKDDVEKVYGLDGATMNTTVQDKLNEEPVSIFNRIRKTLDGVGVSINDKLSEEPAPMQKRIKTVLDGTSVKLNNTLQNTPASLATGFQRSWKPGTLSHPNVLKGTPATLAKDFISKWKPGNLLFPTQTATTPASFASSTAKKINDELSKARNKIKPKFANVEYKGTSKAGGKISFVPKFLAKGGIIKRPTWLDYDKIGGEAGAEAIVPLENNTAWLDKLADRLYQMMGGGNSGGIGQPMIVQVLMPDGRVLGETVVDYATGEAKRTGQLPWAAYE